MRLRNLVTQNNFLFLLICIYLVIAFALYLLIYYISLWVVIIAEKGTDLLLRFTPQRSGDTYETTKYGRQR